MKFILKSGHWPRKCCFKVFLFLALVAILFSCSVYNFSNFSKGDPRNISVKLI